MKRLEPHEMGIYELFVPGLQEGGLYKYLIETKQGERLYKADPFANYAEHRPGTASAPPIRCKDTSDIPKITRTGPCSKIYII